MHLLFYLLEYLMVKCRPFSMPRELTVITIMAVYIPPQANANVAWEKLHTVVSKQQNVYPDGAVILIMLIWRKCCQNFIKIESHQLEEFFFGIRCALICQELIKPLCHLIWACPTMLHWCWFHLIKWGGHLTTTWLFWSYRMGCIYRGSWSRWVYSISFGLHRLLYCDCPNN